MSLSRSNTELWDEAIILKTTVSVPCRQKHGREASDAFIFISNKSDFDFIFLRLNVRNY